MKTYDVMVIGSGFAGMAASLFAARRGLTVVQTGATGGIDFSTGFIDLLAVHPIAEQRVWMDPFAALAELRRDLPAHPYCRVTDEEIVLALSEFTIFWVNRASATGVRPGRNTATLTAGRDHEADLPFALRGLERRGGVGEQGQDSYCRFSWAQRPECPADLRGARSDLARIAGRAVRFPE
jgi:glycerol 3-phosphate dehydrogenase (quinone) subunit B (EC 1.1.5.3)